MENGGSLTVILLICNIPKKMPKSVKPGWQFDRCFYPYVPSFKLFYGNKRSISGSFRRGFGVTDSSSFEA